MCKNYGIPLFLGALFLWIATPLAGQTGVVSGTLTDAESGAPLQDVAVEVLGVGETQAGGMFTDAQGQFRLDLPTGTYSIVFSRLGYETRREDGVRVGQGAPRTLNVTLRSRAFVLNPVIVTASRREEKALDAPAHVEVVGSEAIAEKVAMTPMDHVQALPGIDMVRTGLTQSNVVARGFNNVFSGALLIMVDNRYTHVPSLRFNANNMISTTDADIDRIEVSLGPGAALYGPNSASGVLHIITKSPIDHQGGTAFVSPGFRAGNEVNSDRGSLFHSGFRYAHLINNKTGIKVSGQFFTGDDWEYIDPFELQGPTGGARDFTSERYGGEIRIDHRPTEDSEVVFSAGYNNLAKSIELTGLGAGQADDWAYQYAQLRTRVGRLFAQAFINQSDAGDTYLLQTGQPVVDNSRMMAFQLQHGLDLGGRQAFIYGVDLQRTEPRTGGTITGSNEDDDIIDEVGGYLHSETALTETLDLVAALRIDHHNRLEDLVFSPRAALSLTPRENQNFRLTFNRAFSTPTTNNLFLDIVAAEDPFGMVPTFGVGYDIRTFGVPETGLTFQDQCGGTYCMYSPFAPGTALSAGGPGPLWNLFLQGAAQQNPLLAPLLPVLLDNDPAIATYYRRFNQEVAQSGTGENPFLLDDGPTAIQRIKPTITNTFELGYKGMVSDRLLLAADVYHSRIKDFVGPLRTETPSVFLDPNSMATYLTQKLTPLVGAGVISQAIMQATVENLVTNFAQIPIGTIAPDQRADLPTADDLILTYRNFGDVELWGADLSAQLIVDDRLSFRATGSWVSEECFDFNDDGDCSSARDVALNAPGLKGSFSGRFEDASSGFGIGAGVRYTDGFPMNSGVYIGDLESYAVVDADVVYRLPTLSGASVNLSVNNLFDNQHREFIGAPYIGRLVMLRLQYEF